MKSCITFLSLAWLVFHRFIVVKSDEGDLCYSPEAEGGFCTKYLDRVCNKYGGTIKDDWSGVCDVFAVTRYRLILIGQGEICCIVPDNLKPWYANLSCAKYEDRRIGGCGPFKGYGEDFSLCCDDASSVLFCDTSGVSLMAQLCPTSYSCVTHRTFGKRYGNGGMFAQCEKTEV
jgi:hypothetical protein